MSQILPVLANFAEVLNGMKLAQNDLGDKHKVMAVVQGKLEMFDKP